MSMVDDILLVPKNHEKVASDQLAPKEWAKSEPEDHKCEVNNHIFWKSKVIFGPSRPNVASNYVITGVSTMIFYHLVNRNQKNWEKILDLNFQFLPIFWKFSKYSYFWIFPPFLDWKCTLFHFRYYAKLHWVWLQATKSLKALSNLYLAIECIICSIRNFRLGSYILSKVCFTLTKKTLVHIWFL